MPGELQPTQTTQPAIEAGHGQELVPITSQEQALELARQAELQQGQILHDVMNPGMVELPGQAETPNLPALREESGASNLPALREETGTPNLPAVRDETAAGEATQQERAGTPAAADETAPAAEGPGALPATEQVREAEGDFIRTPSGGKIKIVVAGLGENVRTQAKEAANQRLNEKLAGNPGDGRAKRVLRNMWYGSIMRPRYEAKYTQEAEEQILAEDNLLTHEGVSRDEYRAQTFRRFAHDFDDTIRKEDVIHADAGERLEDLHSLVESGDPDAKALRDTIYDLVERYSSGSLSEADFGEAKKRALNGLAADGTARELIGQGLLYADNLIEIARMVKAEASSRTLAVRDILGEASIIVGKAKIGARTEYDKTSAEHITGVLSKLRGKEAAIAGGRSVLLNEVTISTAVAFATYGAKRGISAALHSVAPGIAAGLYAGAKEAQTLKRERKQHTREMATGKLAADGLDGRRAELEEARYDTASASELVGDLGALYDGDGKLSLSNPEQVRDAMMLLGEVQGRIGMSDRHDIDLISYSSVNAVQKERLDLDLSLAKARSDLRKLVEGNPSLSAFDLFESPEEVQEFVDTGGNLFDAVLEVNTGAAEGVLGGNMAESDAIYRHLRNRRVAQAVVKGFALGEAVGMAGLGVHELTDQGAPAAHAQEALVQPKSSVPLSDHSKLTLPNGYHGSVSHDTVTITGPDGHTLHEPLDKSGNLSAQAQEDMRNAGLNVQAVHDGVVSSEVMSHPTVNAHEFAVNHQHEMTQVSRDYWLDNDTPDKMDLDELGMSNGGVDGTGIAENGDYQFDISGMTEGGSFHGPHAVEWQQAAASGHLKVAVSASEDSQSHVFMLDVRPDGVIDMPKDDPAAALFSVENGHLQFNGGYAETVQVLGHHDGVTHIAPLATVVGTNHEHFTDSVPVMQDAPAVNYEVTPGGPLDQSSAEFSAPADNLQQEPYVITPIGVPVPRDGLKPTEHKDPHGSGNNQPGQPGSPEDTPASPSPAGPQPVTPPPNVLRELDRTDRPALAQVPADQQARPAIEQGRWNDEGAQQAFAEGGEEGYLRYVLGQQERDTRAAIEAAPATQEVTPERMAIEAAPVSREAQVERAAIEAAPAAAQQQSPQDNSGTAQAAQAQPAGTGSDDTSQSGQPSQPLQPQAAADNAASNTVGPRRFEDIERAQAEAEELGKAREREAAAGRVRPAFRSVLDSELHPDSPLVFMGLPRGNPPAVQDLAARLINAGALEVNGAGNIDRKKDPEGFRRESYRLARRQAMIIQRSGDFGNLDAAAFGAAAQLIQYLDDNPRFTDVLDDVMARTAA